MQDTKLKMATLPDHRCYSMVTPPPSLTFSTNPKLLPFLSVEKENRQLIRIELLSHTRRTRLRSPSLRESLLRLGLNFVGPPPVANLVYRQGFKFIGMGKDALDLVCNKLNLQWSIQNKGEIADQLQVIPVNGTLQDAIIQVNQSSGMYGDTFSVSPTNDKNSSSQRQPQAIRSM